MANRNRLSGLLFLVLALICGLGAGFIVYTAGRQAVPTVPVLAAAVDMAAGDPITLNRVRVVKLPPAGLPDDVLPEGTDISGLLAAHGYSAGDILRRAGVLDVEAPDPGLLSSRVRALGNPSLRAMEVPVEAAAGMLGGMKSGDRVDVIAVEEQQQGGEKTVVARTILKGVPVIGVNPGGDSGAGVLVVAVTPEQAEALALARSRGKVYASLLPFGVGGGETNAGIGQ